ncbi:MAG TPA: Hpt domain-containing protein, partial [Patescibacteria group bacterium]|nr:Hpt domain-containing protein [Patescibacteria group bacterium]
VLMDVQMPVMDGLDATRAIRVLAGPVSRIPIIAVSAAVSRTDNLSCIEAGMNDFIGKPFVANQLLSVLEQWANPEGGADAVAATLQSADLVGGGTFPRNDANKDAVTPSQDTGEETMTAAKTDRTDVSHLVVFDPEPVDQLRDMLGLELVLELVEEFESSSLESLASLGRAVGAGDTQTSQREVHGLKSAAATLGLMRMAGLCRAFELQCREGDLSDSAAVIDELQESYVIACEALRHLKG